ncbi:MAG: hypothetical protein Q8R12_01120, partial [bacterium]|nr:hypothetical protein [bacterium]
MTKSKIFFLFCCAFIIGIGSHAFVASDRLIAEPFIWYALFIGCTVLAALGSIFWRWRLGVIRGLALGIFFLGVFRFALVIPDKSSQHLLQPVGQEVTLRGS